MLHLATKLEPRAGAADGKLMVGIAAFTPLALGMGVVLEAVVLAVLRLSGKPKVAIPGAMWLYLGTLFAASLMIASYVFRHGLP